MQHQCGLPASTLADEQLGEQRLTTDRQWGLPDNHSCNEQQVPKVKPTGDVSSESPVRLDPDMLALPHKVACPSRIQGVGVTQPAGGVQSGAHRMRHGQQVQHSIC
jgi:hypothetical protein